MVVVQTSTFGQTGKIVSNVGLGGGQLAYQSQLSKQQISDVIQYAHSIGISYFDTAPWYSSEPIFGQALEKFDRSSYFLATKVGRYPDVDVLSTHNLSAENTEKSVLTSLRMLRTSYIDLIQVHDFDYLENSVETVLSETLPMLDKLRQRGVVKYIGLATFDLPKMKEIVERSPVKIDSILSHSRMTMLDQGLKEYIPYFKSKGCAVVNASMLSLGLLSSSPPKWLKVSQEAREATNLAISKCKESNCIIERLGNGYSYSEGLKNGVDVVLTGCASKDLLDLNLKTFHEGLNEKENSVCQDIVFNVFGKLPEEKRDINVIGVKAFQTAHANIKKIAGKI